MMTMNVVGAGLFSYLINLVCNYLYWRFIHQIDSYLYVIQYIDQNLVYISNLTSQIFYIPLVL